VYTLGEPVLLGITTYRDDTGAVEDATSVSLVVQQPDDTTTSAITLTHVASSGVYSVYWTPTMLGHHTPVFTVTGTSTVRGGVFTEGFDVYGVTITTIADLRYRYPDLADSSKYPDGRVREKLRAAVQQWNDLAALSMAPFGKTYTTVGDGGMTLNLPDVEIRDIVTFTIDGIAVPTTSYTFDRRGGVLTLIAGWFTWRKDVVIHYEYGLDNPPGAVVDAVQQRAVELLVPPQSGLGRMTSVANDLGFARISLAGKDGTTGVPDFDATASLYGRRSAVGFA
jgi:hypothetical protein